VHTAADAAAELAKEGVDCEVLDLRSLVPLDVAGLAASLAKTRRLVVVDEDNPVCSMASEVVATVCTTMWDNLDAGPIMVTPPQSPVPFAPELEAAYQPGPGDVIAAVRRVLEGTRSEVRADAVPH
jgi:pyruvate dehydrogenase E1 component beta subunit